MSVQIRDVKRSDLATFYEFQLDDEANRLAATKPRRVDAFDLHWESVLANTSVAARAILFEGELAGYISCFQCDGVDSIGYWIGKRFWGQGVATRALEILLTEVSVRPLHARVAVANVASLRVLQKCGFDIVGYQHSPADDLFLECEEAILKLPASK